MMSTLQQKQRPTVSIARVALCFKMQLSFSLLEKPKGKGCRHTRFDSMMWYYSEFPKYAHK